MQFFSYCLSLSLLHSLWQSALLLGMYAIFSNTAGNSSPAAKRNLLLGMILLQVLLSLSTFFIYYSGSAAAITSYLADHFSGLAGTGSMINGMAPWISVIYTLAVLYKISALLFRWNHFKNSISGHKIKPGSDIRLFTKVKAWQFGIRRRVSIWYSNQVNGPVTFGHFRPVILLPVALVNNLSMEETESLIIHELTHIRHHDYLINWLLLCAETVYFFNPFIRIMAGKIRLEREKNCDVHVLQFNYPAIGYAETLFKAASLKTSRPPFYLAAAAKNTQLITRIRFFTRENNLAFSKSNHPVFTTAIALLIFIVNIFILQTPKNETVQNGRIVANLAGIRATMPALYAENRPARYNIEAIAPSISNKAQTATTVATASDINKFQPVKEAVSLSETTFDETENDPVNYALPASMDENKWVKELTLKEENSVTGETTTRVFQVSYENGIIETRLLLTIAESRPIYDSAHFNKDSTILINPVQ